MPWVARTQPDRLKMRGLDRPPTITRKLRCGHETDAEPIATSHGRRLYRCPEGCGLQKPR